MFGKNMSVHQSSRKSSLEPHSTAQQAHTTQQTHSTADTEHTQQAVQGVWLRGEQAGLPGKVPTA